MRFRFDKIEISLKAIKSSKVSVTARPHLLNSRVALFAIGFCFAVLAVGLAWGLALAFDLKTFVALLGPVLTGGAIWVAITQIDRNTQHARTAAARVAGLVATEALRLTADRLHPRFFPPLQESEGRTMRGGRSTEMVKALQELKLSDLPPEVMPAFLAVRSGVSALSSAMDEEPWPARDGFVLSAEELTMLGRYRVAYQWASGAYGAYRQLVADRYDIELEDLDWKPPEPGSWNLKLAMTPVLTR